MIERYNKLAIGRRDEYYVTFKGNKFDKYLFKARDIPVCYEHLLAASALMYAQIDMTANACNGHANALESVLGHYEGPEKVMLENVVTILNLIKSNSLTVLRVAEVGQEQAMHDREADKNS